MSDRSILRSCPLGQYATFPAKPEQLALIIKLGGHPPDDLTEQMAGKAINALRRRRGELRPPSVWADRPDRDAA